MKRAMVIVSCWLTACVLVGLFAGWLGKLIANPPLVPAYTASTTAEAILLKQILDELRGMRAEVKLVLASKANPADLKTVMTARCAGCHSVDKAEANGDSFVLIERDGSLSPLSVGQKRSLVRMVEKGLMPKNAALTPEERKVILDSHR